MKASLQKRSALFIQNRDIIKSAFRWENLYLHPLCACMYASRGLVANADMMRQCRSLLKEKTGLFSYFRGTSKMATITALALSSNPEIKMDRMLTAYESLRKVFFRSEYLTVAASAIVDMARPSEYEFISKRTREIYNCMKSAHPILTSQEDIAFAALLAMSGYDPAQIAAETERCYRILKPRFFSSNSVQSLSHVLALGNIPAELKCEKLINLFDYLKSRGGKYGSGYELSTLGIFALLDVDTQTLGDDIFQVNDYLKKQKGFGAFGIGAQQRIMYAGMIVLFDHVPDTQAMQVAALNGVVTLVIAQQAAVCASIAASHAAAAAASST